MKQNPLFDDLSHILDHTRDLWEDLRGSRIFITGGTGFFGCWLLESFLFANEQLNLNSGVTVLTRNPDAFKKNLPHLAYDPAVTLFEGDVRRFSFPAGEYSHVIHAAADASPKLNAKNPLLVLGTIVEGTRHALDFAVSCKAERFFLTSSGAVYGKQPTTLTHIPEDYMGAPDSLDPKSAYGIGKRTAEQLCSLYAKQYGISSLIARGFAFVGHYLPLDAHFAIGNFIRDGINGGPIFIKGDGTPRRSYLYAADLSIWLWTIFFRGEPLRPYNVGSDQALSLIEVANIVAEQFPAKIMVEIHGKPDPNKPVEYYVPDISRAKEELGLEITTPLPSSIKKTIQINQMAPV